MQLSYEEEQPQDDIQPKTGFMQNIDDYLSELSQLEVDGGNSFNNQLD